jgi:hypothetical protein
MVDPWIADALAAREINLFFHTHYTADDIATMPDSRVEELRTVADLYTQKPK